MRPGYKRVRRSDDEHAPVVRYWRDAEQQRRLLTESLAELEQAGFVGADVAVISPAGDDECVAGSLHDPPWSGRLEPLVREARLLGGGPALAGVASEGDWPAACIPSDLDAVDLGSRRTRYCSIYRFKGLEAPAVIITDVTDLDDPAARSLLYVGCTRALHRLVILAREPLRGRL
jgi:hypothetical protein